MTATQRPRPNVFLIGAMKSGTTSLHQYLAQHPQVFMSTPKEPGYFVEELTWSQGESWYLDLFEGAGRARVIGEGSTEYTKLPTYQGVPERIRDFNPDARFVYLMRDPLARIVSHYWHNVRVNGLNPAKRNIATAVAEDTEYIAYSDYAMQLRPWFQLFGRDRVYCVTFEALSADPESVTREVCDWLGLEGDIPPEVFKGRHNVRPGAIRQPRGLGLLSRLAHSAPWSAVSPMVPKSLRRFASSLALKEVRPSASEAAAVLDQIRPQVRERVHALTTLLGRTFPEWTTLEGRRPVTV
jgi:hypothetical protein